MAVYVDDMHKPARVGPTEDRWSHLSADTREELHAFARELGLPRTRFHDHPTRWHYDVTAAERLQAIELGARAIPLREMARLVRARR